MNEQQVRKIVSDENMKNYRAGSPAVPPHQHNESDNLRIHQSDVIYNTKLMGGLLIFSDGGDTYTFKGLSNPTSVVFHGFARSPSGGAATKKATITGRAELGQCFSISALYPQTLARSTIIQVYDSFLADVSGPIHTFSVGAGISAIASVDGTVNTAFATVESWDNTSVTIKVALGTDWSLIGSFIIT